MKKKNTGITLIALVITIIVLLILAGIVISLTIGENGMINKAKESGLVYDEQQAKEKLELVLLDMQADKVTNPEYNQDEYLTKKIEENDMIVNGDIVLVNGWQFQIDRSVPEIGDSLGKGELNENIKLNVTATTSSDYMKSVIKVEIEYAGEIKYISIAGEEIVVPEKTDGKYTVEKEVTANGNYGVLVKDIEDKYKTGSITVSDLTQDMNIYTKEDLEIFRDNVNMGRTYEGRTIKVMNNIDLQGSQSNQWIPIGSYTETTNLYFAGTFDGNNKTIDNLYINNTNDYQGLFGYIKNSEIMNISLNSGFISASNNVGGIVAYSDNATISECFNNATVKGASRVGGIVGSIKNGKAIKCSNKGNITGAHSAGGIAGVLVNNSEVSDSYNAGKIATTTSISTNGNYIAGGIAGYTDNLAGRSATIVNCYNTGSVYGDTHTGGIQGFLQGGGKHNTKNCYSIGTISGNQTYGISGFHSPYNGTPEHIVSNNYWLSGSGPSYGTYNSNTNAEPIDGAILKTYANILGEAYVDDINNINNGYPILKWQVQ